MLVDFLLSLLGQESAFTRRIVNEVFPSICHTLNYDSLNLILTELAKPLDGGKSCVTVLWIMFLNPQCHFRKCRR